MSLPSLGECTTRLLVDAGCTKVAMNRNEFVRLETNRDVCFQTVFRNKSLGLGFCCMHAIG